MIDGLRGRRRQREQRAGARRLSAAGARLGSGLVGLGVSADAVTVTGILSAGATAVVVALGHLLIGAALLTFGGLMDTLDGVVAKAAQTASPRGAFLDSVADRVADGVIFGGVAWYLIVHGDPRLALLPFAVLAASAVVSYERAKAESLGYHAKGGLMERAERLILLGAGLVFSVALVPILWVLLGLTVVTALQRFVVVWRQASQPLAGADGAVDASQGRLGGSRTWREGRVDSRWREWREARVGRRQSAPLLRPWRASAVRRAQDRRSPEPMTTRLRRVWHTESGGRGPSSVGAGHTGLARATRGERVAARRTSALRRRFGADR
jgi:CDP-diacylglycerol--glycerol-3-phosphate 3-phosphatidyltransferase